MAHDPNARCKRCQRRFRPNRTTVIEYPGTVAFSSKGYCTGCWRQAKAEGLEKPNTPRKRATNCADCNRTLRPANKHAKDYPGTVQHAGKDRCKPCLKRYESKREEELVASLPAPEVLQERARTQAWLAKMHHDAQKLERRKKPRLVVR